MLEQFQLGWVTEMNTASIVTTLDRALARGHDAEAAARRERARAVVAENFTWDRIAARMRAVYQAVLGGQPLPSFQLSQVRLKPPGQHAPVPGSPQCLLPDERQ
jgi:hypothetical protein